MSDLGRLERIERARQAWDSRYAHPTFRFGYRPNDFLVDNQLMLRRGSRVLALGDGEGRNGVWLAEQGHRVTSIDLSEVGARKARTLASERGVTVDAHVGDLVEWLADDPAAQGPWDGVVSIFVHLAAEERRAVAELLTPRMSPRGVLLLEAFTPAQLQLGSGGPADEGTLLTRERVVHDWPGLHLDIRITDRRMFEGSGHQGLASVIQVLGRPRPATASSGA
ncbi:MAG TPA: class I SAM-dependent methyltransferase [Propionibacteriaceae bacterium]|nr:class I SAM-dependent methyltransferase [Propionibacteriaceae bacterium]